MGSESSKGEAKAKVMLEAEMNVDWGGWVGFMEEMALAPSFSFIQKTFNKGQLCAWYYSGHWNTLLKEISSLLWLIFWLGEEINKQIDKSIYRMPGGDLYYGEQESRVERIECRGVGVATFIWGVQGTTPQ